MNHFIIKLTSGEFVYGVINDELKEKNMVVVQNPLTWHEYDDDEGNSGSALIKFINGSSDTEIPIATTSIISMARMSTAFENFYEAAVAVQQITDTAYEENIIRMTNRMCDMVLDFQDRQQAISTDELVISHRSSNTTIH